MSHPPQKFRAPAILFLLTVSLQHVLWQPTNLQALKWEDIQAHVHTPRPHVYTFPLQEIKDTKCRVYINMADVDKMSYKHQSSDVCNPRLSQLPSGGVLCEMIYVLMRLFPTFRGGDIFLDWKIEWLLYVQARIHTDLKDLCAHIHTQPFFYAVVAFLKKWA